MARAVALLGWAAAAAAGLPGFTVPAKRYFIDTEWGSMHYITSAPLDAARPTLVLYHANPRSVLEFNKFVAVDSVQKTYNFVASDYFGMGSSDDCDGCVFNTTREYVTVHEWVGLMERVLSRHGVTDRIVPVGDLKGAYVAIEHARVLGRRAAGLVALDPVWFSPETAKMVVAYTKKERAVQLQSDGSHLLTAWHQPSAAPCDWVNSSYCVATEPATLVENEAKLVDRVRALQTQWQYLVAGLMYNDDLLPAIHEIVRAGTPRLIIWATRAVFDMWVGDGFAPKQTVPPVNLAFGARNNTEEFTAPGLMVRNLTGGSEGAMVQNATAVASYMEEIFAS
eukprot:TRINITY_DN15178_c0_g1_i1.p1 TRINITY_DN15178_c0_g1~~TRINITY_DN15178_c0_g1_i1.p1  ORF type:complete len:360 (+),score=118.34 TRINITY_DN15178_c0_g1_i1:68-1081(+)